MSTQKRKTGGLRGGVEADQAKVSRMPSNGRAHDYGDADGSLTLPRLAYTMKETAAILGVSYITVQRLVQRGLLKSSSALRHKLIPVAEIEKFLKSTLN